jgi:dihydrofolate synthase/folylpolyglutamate synthase
MTAYDDCLRTLFALHRFGIKLGLDCIGGLLAGLGNPHTRYRCLHVAGTNGKGSVAATLAALLAEAGFKTGLYTSPHLVKFNERIRIDGRMVSDADVVSAYAAVRDVAGGVRQPTFFEFATAMAFHLFARHKVAWAVVETGMGGRLDATNIVRPEVAVITNISLEHRAYLGGTIAAIAREKAGIAKPGAPVVTGVHQPAARQAVAAAAAACGTPCYLLGQDFRTRRRGEGRFDYLGLDRRWSDLTLRLTGPHQVGNAALALAAAEVLIRNGLPLGEDQVRRALARVRWPGRLQQVSARPAVIVDGAHNLAAARNLARHLAAAYPASRVTLVLGMLDDKPYRGMLAALLPTAARVVICAPVIDRAIPAATLGAAAAALHPAVTVIPQVPDAVLTTFRQAAPDDVICIAGSLYVAGEAMAALERQGLDVWA